MIDKLGNQTENHYTSQVSHHFCYRNVVVLSLRNFSYGETTHAEKESRRVWTVNRAAGGG